jgi:hypothetical protein
MSCPQPLLRVVGELAMSFIEALKRARAEAFARSGDPWRLRLEGLRGRTWDDGIERISTQTVFDVLEVPHRSRTAGACRRLSKLMLDSGGIRSRRGLTLGISRSSSWLRSRCNGAIDVAVPHKTKQT